MKTGAVIQARMTSSRLPGKVLRPLAGEPLLAWVVDAVRRCSVGTLIVATSTHPTDDPVEAFVTELGVPVFRGPLDDVAGRILHAAEAHGLDLIVRICADSPLLDPATIDLVVDAYRDRRPDLATNVFPRTFPRGQSVEVFTRRALERAHPFMAPDDREHVTRWFYSHPDEVSIANVEAGSDLSDVCHCVDTAAEAVLVERVLDSVDGRPWELGVDELARLARRLDQNPRSGSW